MGKILKINPHYYLKNSIWLGVSQIITGILSLVTISILGYFLSKQTFGEYRYLLSIASVIGIIYLSGYNTTLTRQVAAGNLKYYFEATKKVFFTSFVGSTVAVCLSLYYYNNNNTTLATGVFLIGLFTPFINKYLLSSSFFAGKQQFKKTAYFSLIPDIISTVCLLTAAYFNSSAIFLIGTYLLTNVLGNFLIHIKVKNYVTMLQSTQNTRSTQVDFDPNSIHYSIMNIFGVIVANIDKLLIFTMIGSTELAIFFFAQAIPLQARGMLKIINNVTFPNFVNKTIDVKKVDKSVIYLLFLGSIGVFAYIIVAPHIFKYFFPQYLDAITLTQIFSLSVIVYPAIYLLSGIMLAKNWVKSLYKISIYNTITNVIFLLPLAYFYGINGVVLAAIFNSIINFALFYIFFKKENSTF